MAKKNISSGVAYDLPTDLRKTLTSDPIALREWESLSPLARNEWIYWVISVKKPDMRQEHIEIDVSIDNFGLRLPSNDFRDFFVREETFAKFIEVFKDLLRVVSVECCNSPLVCCRIVIHLFKFKIIINICAILY